MKRALTLLALCACALPARANDKWEFGIGGNDDSASTPNAPVHARPQTHDLESTGSPADQDWFRVATRGHQSYEARTYSASIDVQVTGSTTVCQAGFCADLHRVDASGGVLQSAVPTDGESRVAVLRWTAVSDGVDYLRVRGGTGVAWTANDEYTIEVSNTTLFVPRFNNSATQVTVLILQNTTPSTVGGSLEFWSAAGTMLHSEPFTIAPRGVLTTNTSTLAGAAGQSGAISITQNGGYAALVGKAVALEPATGFTFDTPVSPVPR
jgi:hypothetical protein